MEVNDSNKVGPLNQLFAPTMITRNEWDWLNLQDIAEACQKLTDALSARMNATQVDDKLIWEMARAHNCAIEALKRKPKDIRKFS